MVQRPPTCTLFPYTTLFRSLLTDPHGACMHSTRSKLAGALLVASASVALMASAQSRAPSDLRVCADPYDLPFSNRSEEHTSELQSHSDLVCRLLLEKKKYRV